MVEQQIVVKKLFVVGKPGSGKSAAIRLLREYLQILNWVTERFNDYYILQLMFQYNRDELFQPTKDGGFDVVDFSAFDIALRRLEEVVNGYISTALKDALVFIEFSRNDYNKAFALFDEAFLKDAFFL